MRSPSPSSPGLGAWAREPGTELATATALPRQAEQPFVIISESWEITTATEWEPHSHLAHELLWVRNGTLTTRVEDEVFTLSEGYGLWLPAGQEHGGRLTSKVRLFSAFFSPEHTPPLFSDTTVIGMDSLVESLLVHLSDPHLDPAARQRAQLVVFDVLRPAEHSLGLRLPTDPRVSVIAERLLKDPGDTRSLEQWSDDTQISSRTITRAFRAATGLSFVQWRQSARIHRAIELLAAGEEVQDVADMLGYAQPSTFIEAFKRTMGTTPGAFTSTKSRV